MAFLSRIARKVHSSFKFTNISSRCYSDVTPTDSCFIMGKHGPITLPGHMLVSLDEHLKKEPLLTPAAADRLIEIDAQRPYVTNDKSRELFSSGLSLPFFAGLRNESYSGAFSKDNVGVIKVGVIKDLHMFGFKNLVQDNEQSWINDKSRGYNEYGAFLNDLLDPFRSCGGANVCLPCDIEKFLTELAGSNVVVELIMVDAATLTDIQYAQIAQEVYRILLEEYPVRQVPALPQAILTAVGKGSDRGTLQTCQQHAYLNAFLQMHWRNPSLIPASQLSQLKNYIPSGLASISKRFFHGGNHEVNFRIGSLLVRLNRHLVVHPVKNESADTYPLLATKSAANLRMSPPTRAEAIQLARYEFGQSVSVCLSAFKAQPDAWKLLDVRSHVPIPSIHYL